MTALPDKTGAASLTDSATTVGQQKTNLGNLRDFIADLFGTSTAALSTVWTAFKLMTPDLLANYSLAFSVGSSALTIALKTRAGATPSATDPILLGQRSATAGNGDFNLRAVTGATSLVISSGSTLGLANSDSSWVYVYLLDNSGTQELAISQKWFGHSGIASTTAEGGAGGADSATVMYSTTSRSNLPFRAIARIKVPQTAAGTYAAVPTATELEPFEPMTAADGGSLVLIGRQVISAQSQCDFTSAGGYTSAFDGTYEKVVLEMCNLQPGTDGADMWVRLFQSSVRTGASDYGYVRHDVTSAAGGTGTNIGTTADSKIIIMPGLGNTSNLRNAGGMVTFRDLANTSYAKELEWKTGHYSTGGNMVTSSGTGSYLGATSGTPASAIDGIRVAPSTGNISGIFALYGIKKA